MSDGVTVRFICCRRRLTSQDDIKLDSEGFIICPDHGERRYGWRSAPMKQHKLHPFDPDKPKFIERPHFGLSLLDADKRVQESLKAALPQWIEEMEEIETELEPSA